MREGAEDCLWEEGVSEINAGDMVYVARSCSGKAGMVSMVQEVSYGQWCCSCGRHSGFILSARLPSLTDYPNNKLEGWHPVSWLRRIPPIEELDETEHKEELPA